MSKDRVITKWLAIAAVLALLQMMIATTAFAAPPAGGWGGDGGGGNCGTYHKVHRGDTLFSIGRQYGVHPYQIAEVNGLYNPDHIYPGQILYVPCSDGSGHYPGGGDNCCNSGGYYQQPQVGYGYDFTGYYYETYYPNYRRYSYTCGYHYNCY